MDVLDPRVVGEVEVDRPDVTPRTVFFTIESAKVSKREAMNLSYLAETMKKYPDTKYVVNGYADSATGTAEFNKQLAKKRAEAVRKAMSLMGVPDSQMEAVSFGKEKPKALGNNEAAWAENRRADIVYQ